MATDLLDLETTIKGLPGVLGCVILTNPQGDAAEIQAFTRLGVDQSEVQSEILAEVARRGLEDSLRQVFVFELEAESHFGDRESLERAAEVAEQEARSKGPVAPGTSWSAPAEPALANRSRPLLHRVVLTASTWKSEAEVALGPHDEAVGQASGEKTPHGLKVLADATLQAVAQLVPEIEFSMLGASMVNVLGKEAVLVLVQEEGGPETIGAALIRNGPIPEAAVRATLDAINRRLSLASGGR